MIRRIFPAVVLIAAITGCANPDPPAATEVGALAVGQPAPEIALSKLLQAPDGSPTTLAGLKGKAVVLEFWATWCPPCVGSFPHLNELVRATKDDPIVFVAVTDEAVADVQAFLPGHRLDTWVGIDADGQTNARYKADAIPKTVLIDKDGIVRGVTHPSLVTAEVLKDLIAGKPIKLPEE